MSASKQDARASLQAPEVSSLPRTMPVRDLVCRTHVASGWRSVGGASASRAPPSEALALAAKVVTGHTPRSGLVLIEQIDDRVASVGPGDRTRLRVAPAQRPPEVL